MGDTETEKVIKNRAIGTGFLQLQVFPSLGITHHALDQL